MLQLKCIEISENACGTTADIRFELLLNGEGTNQFTHFQLQPDICEVGDVFNLTAHDFHQN